MQQYLPLAVLKPYHHGRIATRFVIVATVSTACGIETVRQITQHKCWAFGCNSTYRLRYWNRLFLTNKSNAKIIAIVPTVYGMRRRVRGSRGAKRRWGPHSSSPWSEGRENRGDKATVLTVYGIETLETFWRIHYQCIWVATVLTACGIETCGMFYLTCHDDHVATYLPLAVLKLKRHLLDLLIHYFSCNSTYCLWYWNPLKPLYFAFLPLSCNSTYRLRYWN